MGYSNPLPQIVLARGESKNRQLFTVAHELGHLFLHWHWYPGKAIKLNTNNNVLSADKFGETMYRGKAFTPEEDDANEFAGNLLMPRNMVLKVFNGLNTTTKSDLNRAKHYVASMFGVLPNAAFVRLTHLKKNGLLNG